ncbi:MAG TPA: hypothetical protein VNS58_28265 [Puia sp.]|nr:hypothetical protein [Puia sp.]
MKKQLLLLLLSVLSLSCPAQTYISLAPSLTNDVGTLAGKSNIAFEIGRQWDVFSLGIDYGKTTLGKMPKGDTSNYIELRPNLNIFQQGKFTNTFTAGIGYIFNSEQSLMTEVTSGIEYAYNERLHINIQFGQYYYSGKMAASSVTFFGVSAMWYFKPWKSRPLISQPAPKVMNGGGAR